MKSAIAFCVFALVAVALARPDGDHYTDKYDNINLDEILGNKKLLEGYIKCILDQGKCTPDGKELKGNIREALENECGKCTDAQRQGTEFVLKHLINHEDAYWTQLTAKYDPDNKYTAKYHKQLSEAKA